MTLTRSGWPRPIVGKLPVPWISPTEDLGFMDPARKLAAATGAVCAVCGLDYLEDEPAWVLVQSDEPIPEEILPEGEVHPMDNGIMHRRCLVLALRHCPALRRIRAEGRLYIFRTRGNWTTVDHDDLQAMIPGADCVLEELPGRDA
jgi:hypothetical protein